MASLEGLELDVYQVVHAYHRTGRPAMEEAVRATLARCHPYKQQLSTSEFGGMYTAAVEKNVRRGYVVRKGRELCMGNRRRRRINAEESKSRKVFLGLLPGSLLKDKAQRLLAYIRKHAGVCTIRPAGHGGAVARFELLRDADALKRDKWHLVEGADHPFVVNDYFEPGHHPLEDGELPGRHSPPLPPPPPRQPTRAGRSRAPGIPPPLHRLGVADVYAYRTNPFSNTVALLRTEIQQQQLEGK